jgi:hypothetical protein
MRREIPRDVGGFSPEDVDVAENCPPHGLARQDPLPSASSDRGLSSGVESPR